MRILSPARLLRQLVFAGSAVALIAFGGLAGGCHRTHPRPASALSDADRKLLEAYERIRAALAADDYFEAHRQAALLADALKPADAKQPPSSVYIEAQFIADAKAMDRQRDVFLELSESVAPLVEGVDGYYVMTSPLNPRLVWVQRTKDVDNPYMGKVMHEVGALRK